MSFQLNILNGPGKSLLQECCFNGRKIWFDIEPLPVDVGDYSKGTSRVFAMWIGVQAESGDGNSWNLNFYPFKGWYRTAKSKQSEPKGYLKFEDPEKTHLREAVKKI